MTHLSPIGVRGQWGQGLESALPSNILWVALFKGQPFESARHSPTSQASMGVHGACG